MKQAMDDLTPSVVGENIKNVRVEKKLSQQDVSQKSGIGRAQISRIESSSADPQLSTVLKIASALDVDVNTLFQVSRQESLHPLVKWAGGKTQLLDRIVPLLPEKFGNYYEPFVGGGAVFLRILPSNAHINDMNTELIDVYRCFTNAEDYQSLMDKLDEYQAKHSEEFYFQVRALDRDSVWVSKASVVDRAARMIYLNKACFNGLYRVNSKGFFNVPSAKKKKVTCYSKKNFQGVRDYFSKSKITLTTEDFAEAVKDAQAGDFVYFDPPYDTWEGKDSFTSYDKDGFGKKDQARLADCYRELDRRGVKLMLSNHNTEYINELYKGFNIHVVNAKRMINSNPNGRGDVEEVLITNY